MTLHKEGYRTIFIVFSVLALINILNFVFLSENIIARIAPLIVSFGFLMFVTFFFRDPKRKFTTSNDIVISPADGKVVVVEETVENEYFEDKRLQISIFMSAWNVHINRMPVSGTVSYTKYHPGLYLLAKNPKSSTENERSTIAVKQDNGKEILFRQIAGYVARRVVTYSKPGDTVKQTDQMGFIKFGSRVDIFLPLDSKINVKIGDKVKGGITKISELVG